LIKTKYFLVVLILPLFVFTQEVELRGNVYGNSDIEGIHIINRTSQRFATTNSDGEFAIYAKHNDTLLITSVRYKQKMLLVSKTNISTRRIKIYLEEHINELNQVTVGKILTGDLNSDIENEGEEREMNFYDVGIQGYTGKPKTQRERKLYEADHGKYYRFPFVLNTNKILNAITGRTKKLKEHVRLERNNLLIYQIKANVGADFFKSHPIEETRRMEFFFFCSDDPDFERRCAGKSEIEIYEFLLEKHSEFTANLEGRN